MIEGSRWSKRPGIRTVPYWRNSQNFPADPEKRLKTVSRSKVNVERPFIVGVGWKACMFDLEF